MSTAPSTASVLSQAIIALMRGIVDRAENPGVWHAVVDLQARIRDHLSVLGLDLVLVEDDGYAYLRQRPSLGDGADAPRLIPRRPLSYPVSVVLVALRKRMTENDAQTGDQRLIVTQDAIAELVRVFLPDTAAEVRFRTRLAQILGQVERLGFIRELKGREGSYEVRRILRAFIDAQWLQTFADRLAKHAEGTVTSVEEGVP